MEILSYGNFDKSHSFRYQSDTNRCWQSSVFTKWTILLRIISNWFSSIGCLRSFIRIFWVFNDFPMYASLDLCLNSLPPIKIKPSLASNYSAPKLMKNNFVTRPTPIITLSKTNRLCSFTIFCHFQCF